MVHRHDSGGRRGRLRARRGSEEAPAAAGAARACRRGGCTGASTRVGERRVGRATPGRTPCRRGAGALLRDGARRHDGRPSSSSPVAVSVVVSIAPRAALRRAAGASAAAMRSRVGAAPSAHRRPTSSTAVAVAVVRTVGTRRRAPTSSASTARRGAPSSKRPPPPLPTARTTARRAGGGAAPAAGRAFCAGALSRRAARRRRATDRPSVTSRRRRARRRARRAAGGHDPLLVGPRAANCAAGAGAPPRAAGGAAPRPGLARAHQRVSSRAACCAAPPAPRVLLCTAPSDGLFRSRSDKSPPARGAPEPPRGGRAEFFFTPTAMAPTVPEPRAVTHRGGTFTPAARRRLVRSSCATSRGPTSARRWRPAKAVDPSRCASSSVAASSWVSPDVSAAAAPGTPSSRRPSFSCHPQIPARPEASLCGALVNHTVVRPEVAGVVRAVYGGTPRGLRRYGFDTRQRRGRRP